jgi:SAM-dependent methyltransferase
MTGIIKWLQKSILLNPIWILERINYRKVSELISQHSIKTDELWLDVGCGERPYEDFFPKGVYIGVDVEDSGREARLKVPDYFYDGRTLPFSDNHFDGVLCTQVLEHVPDPNILLLEIARVLKPRGSLIISVPFVHEEHEQPFDFFRFSSFGMRELLINTNFEIECITKDTSAIITLGMLTNIFIVNNLVPKIKGTWAIFAFLFCFPIQGIAIILSKILPDQGSLYLNLIVKAIKKSDVETTPS